MKIKTGQVSSRFGLKCVCVWNETGFEWVNIQLSFQVLSGITLNINDADRQHRLPLVLWLLVISCFILLKPQTSWESYHVIEAFPDDDDLFRLVLFLKLGNTSKTWLNATHLITHKSSGRHTNRQIPVSYRLFSPTHIHAAGLRTSLIQVSLSVSCIACGDAMGGRLKIIFDSWTFWYVISPNWCNCFTNRNVHRWLVWIKPNQCFSSYHSPFRF